MFQLRCLAWHPHTHKLAVGYNDDTVRVVTSDDSATQPLLKFAGMKVFSFDFSKYETFPHQGRHLPRLAAIVRVAACCWMQRWRASLDNRPCQRGLEAFFFLCCQVPELLAVELRKILLQQTRLEGLQGPATSVSWSPDGKLVAACSPSDTKLHIWSPASQVLVSKAETPCDFFSKIEAPPVSTLCDNLYCRYVRLFTEGVVVESHLPV